MKNYTKMVIYQELEWYQQTIFLLQLEFCIKEEIKVDKPQILLLMLKKIV